MAVKTLLTCMIKALWFQLGLSQTSTGKSSSGALRSSDQPDLRRESTLSAGG